MGQFLAVFGVAAIVSVALAWLITGPIVLAARLLSREELDLIRRKNVRQLFDKAIDEERNQRTVPLDMVLLKRR
jgi:hypothetical protein